MKKLILLACILPCLGNAQIFAPPGAAWHYITQCADTSGNGEWHPTETSYSYTGDTTYHDTLWQKVRPYCPYTWGCWGFNLFFSTNDAIYVYNRVIERTYKAYDYSMAVGDSMKVYELSCNNWPGPGNCTWFTSIAYYATVTSKGTDIINGMSYRWVEYTSNNPSPTYHGKYYEYLGPPGGYFSVWYPTELGIDETDECAHPCLATYSDNIGHSYASSACIATDIPEHLPMQSVSAYPNPVTDGVIRLQSQSPVQELFVMNMLGQKVAHVANVENNSVFLSLPSGTYIAWVQLKNNTHPYPIKIFYQ